MTISTSMTSDDEARGRDAEAPGDIPALGLKDVFWRVIAATSRDRISLIAAGVSFYMLLALFPILGALVSLYGFFADPLVIGTHLRAIGGLLPPGAFDLIYAQLEALTKQNTSSLSIGFVTGLGIALWGSHNGIMALFDAMNIAYNEEEKRGLVKLNLLALAFTIGILAVLIVTLAAMALVPVIMSFFWLDTWTEIFVLVVRWPVVLLLVGLAASCLYRFGPSREPAKLRWLTWGAGLSTGAWFLASLGFSFYLQHFGNYSATYGALGALAGFMVWLWLSAIIFLVGAELNAELEHQTERDTTTGAPRPMGSRGAYMADTVGKAVE